MTLHEWTFLKLYHDWPFSRRFTMIIFSRDFWKDEFLIFGARLGVSGGYLGNGGDLLGPQNIHISISQTSTCPVWSGRRLLTFRLFSTRKSENLYKNSVEFPTARILRKLHWSTCRADSHFADFEQHFDYCSLEANSHFKAMTPWVGYRGGGSSASEGGEADS